MIYCTLINIILRFYRLNKKRVLAKLFGYGKNVCTDVHSGIGNIEYVKDIRTQTVVTRTFNCSKFGPHLNAALGWVIILERTPTELTVFVLTGSLPIIKTIVPS